MHYSSNAFTYGQWTRRVWLMYAISECDFGIKRQLESGTAINNSGNFSRRELKLHDLMFYLISDCKSILPLIDILNGEYVVRKTLNTFYREFFNILFNFLFILRNIYNPIINIDQAE